MATVTGYTAARMKEIEDSAIVGGEVVVDDLILTRFDGGEINAGNVRGPQGIQGPPGDVAEAPEDGVTYARKDGVWVPVAGGVKTVKQTITSGDISPTIGSYSALSTTHDLVLDAEAGDEIGLEIAGRWDANQAGALTYFTRVSGANLNDIAAGYSYGVTPWCADGDQTHGFSFGGEWLYTVQAGDVVAGQVTFRAHGKSIGATRVLRASTTYALRLQAKNYKQ